MASLFCYGTLQVEGIITRLIGRVPDGEPSQLENYVRWCIRNTDFPAIIPKKKSVVSGVLYRNLTPKEIRILDDYEGDYYKRVQVWVETEEGKTEHAWVYVLQNRHHGVLDDEPWSIENYLRFKVDSTA